MNPVSHGLKKGFRTLLQLVAGGALTALVAAVIHGLTPASEGLIMGAWTAVVAFAQNALEASGALPVLLPTAQSVAVSPPVVAPPAMTPK